MKKAVIEFGSNQFLVSEGDEIRVDKITNPGKSIKADVLALIDGADTSVGTPIVKGASVTLTVLEEVSRDPKTTAIRFKAKKRVHKKRGAKQQKTVLKVTKIS